MFFTRGKSKSELENEIIELENRLTDERDLRINAEITLSRSESQFNSRLEEERSSNQIEVVRLEGQVKKLEASLENGIEAGVRTAKAQMERELESDKASYRKMLKNEYQDKSANIEKENKSLRQDKADLSGENSGLRESNKVLVGQLTQVNKFAEKLSEAIVKSMPEVTANITTPNPSVVVGSGNKG